MLKTVINHNTTETAMKKAKTTTRPAVRKSHPVKRERQEKKSQTHCVLTLLFYFIRHKLLQTSVSEHFREMFKQKGNKRCNTHTTD